MQSYAFYVSCLYITVNETGNQQNVSDESAWKTELILSDPNWSLEWLIEKTLNNSAIP